MKRPYLFSVKNNLSGDFFSRLAICFGSFLLLSLSACSGSSGESERSSVLQRFSIKSDVDSALLEWDNPTLSGLEGIFKYTIRYQAVHINTSYIRDILSGVGLKDSNLSLSLDRAMRDGADETPILDWDKDKVFISSDGGGDNCRHIFNLAQGDRDEDGIGDACDNENSTLRLAPAANEVTVGWVNPFEPDYANGSRQLFVGYPGASPQLQGGNLTLSFSNEDNNLTVEWTNPARFGSDGANVTQFDVNITQFKITIGNIELVYMVNKTEEQDRAGTNVSIKIVPTNRSIESERNITVIAANIDNTSNPSLTTDYVIGMACVFLAGDSMVAPCGTKPQYRQIDTQAVISNFTLTVFGPSNFMEQIVIRPQDAKAAHVSFDYRNSADNLRIADSYYVYDASNGLAANRIGVNMTGGNMTGDNMSGDNMTGDNMIGDNMTGDNMIGDNMTGDNMIGDNMTGDNRIGPHKFRFSLAISYINASSGMVIHNNLTEADSPINLAYNGTTILGANNDQDALRDEQDPDDDNDGILDEADPNLGKDDPYPFRSAVRGILEIEYNGDPSQLSLYSGKSSSYKLEGLASNNYYNISVTAHIRSYRTREYANSRGYNANGALIADSINTNLEERLANTLTNPAPVPIGADTDGDGIINLIDGDDDNDEVLDDFDLFPLNASEWADSDGDGTGDNADRNNTLTGMDSDNDTVLDLIDIDDDGDGLIEIDDATKLNAIRYELDGTGLRLSHNGYFNRDGCGNGKDVTSCRGYELVNNISLRAADYPSATEGWLPIGGDAQINIPSIVSTQGCQGEGFSATFDGNGNTIHNLTINRPNELCVGLFGELEPAGEIRSLHVRASSINGLHGVGTLVGVDWGGVIVNSSATAESISATDYVGGLLGYGWVNSIESSTATIGTISGDYYVGGLAGYVRYATIMNATAETTSISSTGRSVGGLIGLGWQSSVISSGATSGSIMAADVVGGLIGSAYEAEIENVTAASDEISGDYEVGGLAGNGNNAVVRSAVAETSTIGGYISVGGLLGVSNNVEVFESHADFKKLTGSISLGGLIGSGRNASVYDSSAVFDNITGNGRQLTRSNSPSFITSDYHIGGLIGDGSLATVISSSANASLIKGKLNIGGLMGRANLATIIFSSAATENIEGIRGIGGLLGKAGYSVVQSSYALTDTLKSTKKCIRVPFVESRADPDNNVGGLIGAGTGSTVLSSFAITGAIRETGSYIGGLIGNGDRSQILASYAVLNDADSACAFSASLIGSSVQAAINSSYAISGDIEQPDLISGIYGTSISQSYWDLNTSKEITGTRGNTTKELQAPTNFTGLYEHWDEPLNSIYTPSLASKNVVNAPEPVLIDSNLSVNCDDNLNGEIDSDEEGSFIWDFGNSSQYPVIRCTPFSPTEQRNIWSVDNESNIILNFPDF